MHHHDHFHAEIDGPKGHFEVEGGWNAHIKPASGPRFSHHELLILASAWTERMPGFDAGDPQQTTYRLVSFGLAG